jgi:hypothetical protein
MRSFKLLLVTEGKLRRRPSFFTEMTFSAEEEHS